MKIGIVGSRNFSNLTKLEEYMSKLPKDTIIVSGGGGKVDKKAEEIAKRLGFKTEIYPADWNNLTHPDAVIKVNKFGKKYDANAGHRRNEQIAIASDKIVAFWDGKSPGTASTLRFATKHNKPYEIIRP